MHQHVLIWKPLTSNLAYIIYVHAQDLCVCVYVQGVDALGFWGQTLHPTPSSGFQYHPAAAHIWS